ncbi:MAG TPA: slipin family protein [Candidatus Caenarcaniphilales bacterium]
MQDFGIITLVLVIFGLAVRACFKKITVFEFERGLKYHKGKFAQILRPGQYWIYIQNTSVTLVDVRPKFISLPGQELLSADSISLKVSATAKYEVADPYLAINRIESYESALYIVFQLALRELVGSLKIDELLERRNSSNQRLMELAAPKVEELGLRLLSFDVKDVMFPGDLKRIFTQVVKARQEGLAALEKARGETAALRNLANASKLIENNPTLLQLRLLRSLEESSGNTFVLDMPLNHTLLPIKVEGQTTTGANQIKHE